jgi:hypothetical protein
MLRWLIRRWIAGFERTWDYDASYVRDILEAGPRAALIFNRVAALGAYRRDAPADALYAAKITTARAEDCGPCTQLGVTMAEREGIDPALLRAVIDRDEARMTEAARLGFRFAEATLAHDSAADDWRQEIVQRWGHRALVSLAFGIASARLFPTVKYALGHGKACQRITIGGRTAPTLRQAA